VLDTLDRATRCKDDCKEVDCVESLPVKKFCDINFDVEGLPNDTKRPSPSYCRQTTAVRDYCRQKSWRYYGLHTGVVSD
jgi:hypothetical protein